MHWTATGERVSDPAKDQLDSIEDRWRTLDTPRLQPVSQVPTRKGRMVLVRVGVDFGKYPTAPFYTA